MPKVQKKNSGRDLNERWGVHAKHALYREDGAWYHLLKKFPGALFDANGYVLFADKDAYKGCPHLRIGEHTHCPNGISSIPEYVLVGENIMEASDMAEPQGTIRALSTTNRIVRDTPLARYIKKLHKNRCQVCGLTLLLYGGESYAEAHHIMPLGSIHNGPDVAGNIICVCPNCHAQLDYGAIELHRATLRSVSKHSVENSYVDYHNSNIYKGSAKFVHAPAL